jgi:phytoene desaturase
MQNKKAIIIGSGVAGLAAAIRLQIMGFEVSVFEKNSYPGGKLHAFERDGFRFDAGPSLFTQPHNIEELFVLAGEPIGKYFSYNKIDVACKYFYENGKTVTAFADTKLFAKELQQQLNENPQVVEKYLQESKKAYQNIGAVFLNYSLHKAATWFHTRIIKALATVKPGYLFGTLHSFNKKKFVAPETVQLFNRFATYNGSNPYKAPGMLSLIPHLEMNEGTFYPQGGMISITNALYELAKTKGVRFYFSTPVQKIVQQNGVVKGIYVNDKMIEAPLVVSNGDVYFTYKHLLENDTRAKKVLQQERSSSAVIFYWGIKKTFPSLQLHNIFFSADYKSEFDAIFTHKKIFSDPTVYINITSKMENGMAPAAMENWFVMINTAANTGQNWDDIKKELKAFVIKKLSRLLGEDISALIVTEQTLDPVLIEEQTSSYMGSLYGTSSNSKLAAFLRHANFTGDIEGLYFCGGSVHPGGGIPLCLKSAKIVSGLIASNLKIQK